MVAMLTRPTLVLNRNWRAVGVASVARSLTLVAAERARIVDPSTFQQYTWADWAQLVPQEDEVFIQSVKFRIRVPEVITLTEYDRVPTNAVTFSRRNIFKRDHFTCQYCGGHEDLTFDHVVPRSKGGRTTWENIVAACSPCNLKKGGRLPEQAKMRPARRPERPTMFELNERGRAFPPNYLHESWQDFLYWDSELLP